MQSSTKTRSVNGKTETVHRQTISNRTQVQHGDNNVKMTFSQQMDKRSDTDEHDRMWLEKSRNFKLTAV